MANNSGNSKRPIRQKRSLKFSVGVPTMTENELYAQALKNNPSLATELLKMWYEENEDETKITAPTNQDLIAMIKGRSQTIQES